VSCKPLQATRHGFRQGRALSFYPVGSVVLLQATPGVRLICRYLQVRLGLKLRTARPQSLAPASASENGKKGEKTEEETDFINHCFSFLVTVRFQRSDFRFLVELSVTLELSAISFRVLGFCF
jgi:hypothetical protein